MKFGYKTLINIFLLLFIGFTTLALAQVPYTIYGNVYNSDDSAPATGDITITAYLEKNPSNTYVFSNGDASLWGFELTYEAGWIYYSDGSGGSTNANPGDYIIVEFLNTNSESPFFGESGQIRDFIVGGGSSQQFGPSDFSLPVELSSFQAKIQSNQVVLNWTTQAELNNLGFNIYKSISGQSEFQLNAIIIDGAGTSTSSHSYEYIDTNVKAGESYTYSLESVDINGQKYKHQSISVTVDANATPDKHELMQNFPNPFNPSTQIRYRLGADSHVRLSVYNAIGDLVIQLANEQQSTGYYSYMWDGKDGMGNSVSAGLYFYKLDTNQVTQVRKMIYTK